MLRRAVFLLPLRMELVYFIEVAVVKYNEVYINSLCIIFSTGMPVQDSTGSNGDQFFNATFSGADNAPEFQPFSVSKFLCLFSFQRDNH